MADLAAARRRPGGRDRPHPAPVDHGFGRVLPPGRGGRRRGRPATGPHRDPLLARTRRVRPAPGRAHPGRPRRARTRRPGRGPRCSSPPTAFRSGRWPRGTPIPDQVAESGADIAALLGLDADATVTWGTAWQSAGRTADPWIGPDLLVEMERVAAEGATAVVVCPVGFVSDHLEILYDLDIEARRQGRRAGHRLRPHIVPQRRSRVPRPTGPTWSVPPTDTAADGRDGGRHQHVSDPSGPADPVVAVVGGGMAGLAAAWELVRPRDGVDASPRSWSSRPVADPAARSDPPSSAGGPSTWPPTRSWPGAPRRPVCAANSA